MTLEFSHKDIEYWCGKTASTRGLRYYQEGRVRKLQMSPDKSGATARVLGTDIYRVKVEWVDEDMLGAECDCPAFDKYSDSCKHIAAVLFAILDEPAMTTSMAARETAVTVSAPAVTEHEQRLTEQIIKLFTATQQSGAETTVSHSSERLVMDYNLRVFGEFGNQPYIALGLRVGVKRTYKVQKVGEFLQRVEHGERMSFTKNFTFDPTVQSFSPTDAEIIQKLVDTYHMQQQYMSLFHGHAGADGGFITLPPMTFRALLPLLTQSKVEVNQSGRSYEGIAIADHELPINFQLRRETDGIHTLDLSDLSELVVLKAYGCAAMGGQLYFLKSTQLDLLAILQSKFRYERDKQLRLGPSQLRTVLERVVPVLHEFGKVDVADDAISGFATYPANAKLYLDTHVRGLSLDLVFQYGDTAIRPLLTGDPGNVKDAQGRMVIRDRATEDSIISMVTGLGTLDGQSLVLTDNETIYEFVYHILPQLEDRVEVFATEAVDPVVRGSTGHPRTSVDVGDNQWLEIRFDIDGIATNEIQSVLRSIVERKRYHRLKDGSFVSLESDEYASMRNLVDEIGLRLSSVKNGTTTVPLMQGFHLLANDKKSGQIKLGKRARSLMDDILNPDNLDFPVPNSLQHTLREYQKYGFQWMKTLAHYRFGGVLADDMGLGKTIQSIAFILSELDAIRSAGTPTLIVSPASLIYNWRNEIQKFAPDVRVTVIAGTQRERAQLMNESERTDVFITSYPLLRMDIDHYQDRMFHTIILDEAQAIKNHTTQTAQAVRELGADRRFALTGTPIENSLDDLWSIFHFVFPAMFPSHKTFSSLSGEQIANRVRPFILRRLKRDVLKELPEKIETVQKSELSGDQKKLYLAYLERIQEDAAEQLRDDGFQKSRMKILAGLTRLRQLCCHPGLFVENYGGSSGKLEQLLEVLEECRDSGRRVLVFSQFTEMLGIIRSHLEEAGVRIFYLDGSTPSLERIQLCERFNQGERDVFLISLKAGGTGLNLTGADTVILYDLWWNPAVEEQAADRAHRIGQKNVVQVIRLIAQGTIEERIYELQQKKRDLIDQVVEAGEGGLGALTEAEIRELLMIT